MWAGGQHASNSEGSSPAPVPQVHPVHLGGEEDTPFPREVNSHQIPVDLRAGGYAAAACSAFPGSATSAPLSLLFLGRTRRAAPVQHPLISAGKAFASRERV